MRKNKCVRTLFGVVLMFLGASLSLSVFAEYGDDGPSYKHRKKKAHEHCHSHRHSHDDQHGHSSHNSHRHYHCHEHKHKHRGEHQHDEFNSREHRHAPHPHAHSPDHHDHHDRRRNHDEEQGHDDRHSAPIDRGYPQPESRPPEYEYAPRGVQHSEYISNGRCNRPKAGGRIAGAVIGGLLGSQIGKGKGKKVATVVGVLAGFQIGRHMDKADQVCSGQALEHARNNERTVWDNPDNGTRYTVTPVRTYQNRGYHCREYTTETYINGRPEIVRGNACRQPDGSWQAAN